MRLFYREFGSGIPLIILHGLYGSSDNWVSIARTLSDSFRVIIPDQRNHGASPHSPFLSYKDMSQDLEELTIELGLSRFYLLGHSMGGKTAMTYAREHAKKVAGLIVIDISPFRIERENSPQMDFHSRILTTLCDLRLETVRSRDDAEKILSETISSSKIRRFILKNISRNEDNTFRWKLNPEYLRSNLANILSGVEREDAAAKSVKGFPVLFIRAGNSDYIADSDLDDIRILFPAAEIVTIENTSHWIHAEKPDKIIELIREMADY